MVTGLVSCLVLGALGPNVWNPIEGKAIFVGDPLVPLSVPAIITIPLGFLAGYVGSIVGQSQSKSKRGRRNLQRNPC